MPARITGAFRVEEAPGRFRDGRQIVRLLEPLEYRVADADSAERIVVPAGFETDFASIPFGLRNLFPPLGPWARPAIIHDWLYANGGRLPERRYSRAEADAIFAEAMKVVGVPAWRRRLMHLAVRIGGVGGWGRSEAPLTTSS
jgi:hypothetical protein